MGKRIRKWRREHPRFPEEEPNSRPSLAGEAAGWLSSKPASARRMLYAGGCILAAAAIVATVAWAASATYSGGGPADEGAGGGAYADSSASSSERSQHANCFQNIGYWTFLRSEGTIAKVEDGIYGQLLAGGLDEGSFVVVYEQFDQADFGYVGYIRDTPRGKYWKCAIQAGSWDVTLTEASEADMPRPAGSDQIEEDPWETQGAAAADTFGQQQASAEPSAQAGSQQAQQQAAAEPSASSDDGIGASNGTALSDQQGLDSILPKAAAATVADTLVSGAQASYGVKASASSSYILRSSVKASGQNCTFRVKLAEAGGKSVVLDVSYDSSTGRFTGAKAS